VGAALHPAAHRGGTAILAQRRWPWFVDETYVGVEGVWRYVYRAVDQYGHVIDIHVSKQRNVAAAAGFFETMLAGRDRPLRSPRFCDDSVTAGGIYHFERRAD